jgi:hypothetical protein
VVGVVGFGVAGAGAAVVVVGAAVVGVCAVAADETTHNAMTASIAKPTTNARRRCVHRMRRVVYHTR